MQSTPVPHKTPQTGIIEVRLDGGTQNSVWVDIHGIIVDFERKNELFFCSFSRKESFVKILSFKIIVYKLIHNVYSK